MPEQKGKVLWQTLGCKVNQCETERLKKILESKTSRGGVSGCGDVVMVNTCCVTNRSEYESRQAVRKAVVSNPDAVVMAIGCAVEKNPDSFSNIPGVDFALGNKDKMSLEAIELKKQTKTVRELPAAKRKGFPVAEAHAMTEKTRAFLKIQDGCDCECSYCIVPSVRGPARSVGKDEVLSEIGRLVRKGFREIVLTGINLGKYLDVSETDLGKILEKIIELPGDFRIRLSSIEPEEINDTLLDLISHPKICKHLHIPLQSADNDVLRRMNRGYSREDFAELLYKVSKVSNKISIGTDIITGFPGETDKEFQATYNFLQNHPFSYFHVFRYSQREGTPAATMPDQVHGTVKKERSLLLRDLSASKKDAFEQSQVGKELEVLILSERAKGSFTGLTENYINLTVNASNLETNRIFSVKIGIEGRQITGKVL